jgi:hypothetical protein
MKVPIAQSSALQGNAKDCAIGARVRVVGRAACACGTKPRRGMFDVRKFLIAKGQSQQNVM